MMNARLINILKSNRGIALLLTLSVTAFLMTTALFLNKKMRVKINSTALIRDRLTLSHIAASGIHIGMGILIKDKEESTIDADCEDWARPEKINEILQDFQFGKGKVTLNITDELARMNINALVDFPKGRKIEEDQKKMWERYLYHFFTIQELFDDIERDKAIRTVIYSLIDWLDSGDDDAVSGTEIQSYGAENDFYQGLEQPYSCRNGHILHIEELLLVNGVTKTLFNGIGPIPGLSGSATVFGKFEERKKNSKYEGKININTAGLPVIAALLPIDNYDLADDIFNERHEDTDDEDSDSLEEECKDEVLKGGWYSHFFEGDDDLKKWKTKTFDKLITDKSDFYRIESTGELNDMTATITAIVKREKAKKSKKWTCKVLSWESK